MNDEFKNILFEITAIFIAHSVIDIRRLFILMTCNYKVGTMFHLEKKKKGDY